MKTIVFSVLIILAAGYGMLLKADAAGTKDPKALFEETCSQCHSIDIPKGEKMSRDDWAYTVSRMRNNGLGINDQEAALIVDYLAANHGKN